jgi:hypothetical protein
MRSPVPWSYDPATETIYDAAGDMVAARVSQDNAAIMLLAPDMAVFIWHIESGATSLRMKSGFPLLRCRAEPRERSA